METGTMLREQHFNFEQNVSKDPYLKLLSCGKSYHVCFIYHAHAIASNWVKDTVQTLEYLGYNCFYQERDFIAGRTKTSNIIFSLENSIKFVVVITDLFMQSPHCQYELDLALDECINRKGELIDLIPVVIGICQIPKQLKVITALYITEKDPSWMSKLIQAIDEEQRLDLSICTTSENSVDKLADGFYRQLKCLSLNEMMTFLCKPVAMELSHFLSQHDDLRMFISAMNTCGITFDGNIVKVNLSVFRDHLEKEHYVAQCFSEHVKKLQTTVSKVSLLLNDETYILNRQNDNVMNQFTNFVKTVLKIPKNEFWGIMWNMKGVQMRRKLRDECRQMIHDAVNEQEITEIAHPDKSTLAARLETFRDWPTDKLPTPLSIAEAGYFVEGPNDVLRCFYCNGVSWDLKPYEDPRKRHAKWLFYCPYIKELTGRDFIKMARFAEVDERKVYNPLFASLDTRISSYKGWTSEMGPCIRDMAKAGFYFTKLEDKVVCYTCGYGVRDWTPKDNPWYKHAWWSPYCIYVRRNKGQAFIDRVQSDRTQTEPSDYCMITYNITTRYTK